jgi:AraC-like DNA-binding protein
MVSPGGIRLSHPKVAAALSILSKEYTDPHLQLLSISTRLRITPGHLCHLIKQRTGRGFRQHLRDLRLSHAQEHLAGGFLSIKEVAGAVGFNSTSAFDREFARVHGCSPTQWRRQICEDHLHADPDHNPRKHIAFDHSSGSS